MATTTTFDRVGFIMAYECGELEEDAVIEGFQHLINEGTVWSLQGSYGRMATALIEAGYCTDPRDAEPVNVKPELIGTRCECGAPYDEKTGGYSCAR